MTSEQMRGVFDNNLLVSAALLAGVPRKAFDRFLDNCKALISVPVLLELADVLNREKFDKYVTHDERMRFMVSFLKVAEMVEISETITACRDPKDDKLLELAVVTLMFWSGDKDCLSKSVREWKSTPRRVWTTPWKGIVILKKCRSLLP